METQTDFRPTSQKVIAILDDAIPKIKFFCNLPYTKANTIIDNQHLQGHWKGKKKNFGSFIMNMDNKHICRILEKIGIELSEPNKEYQLSDSERLPFVYPADLTDPREQEAANTLYKATLQSRFPYEFMPMEAAVVKDFCLYALNHCDWEGFSQEFIDTKGWIKAWNLFTANDKIKFANEIIDFH